MSFIRLKFIYLLLCFCCVSIRSCWGEFADFYSTWPLVDIINQGEYYDFSKYTMAHLKIYQNKRTEAIELLETLFNSNNLQINNKMKFECAYQNFLHNNLDKTITLLNEIDKDSAFKEKSIILLSEIYDYILNNKSAAVDLYLEFLDLFPNSIYYDMVRMRLRELAS